MKLEKFLKKECYMNNELKTEFRVIKTNNNIDILQSTIGGPSYLFSFNTKPLNDYVKTFTESILKTQDKLFLEAFNLPYSEENLDKIKTLLTSVINNSNNSLLEENQKLKNEINLLKS